MEKSLRDKIKLMVLKSKEILEEEITRILEGKYGIHKDGKIENIDDLKELSFDDISFRKEIEIKFFYLVDGGFGKRESFNKIVREVAYTILNRLAALRFMDENNITQESIKGSLNSKGFSLFKKTCNQLTSQENLYLLFLNLIYDDLSVEVPVLFDRVNESKLQLSLLIIKKIIDIFNQDEILDIWSQEETLGWIYQYFFSKDKEKIREKKKGKDLPKNSYELIAINQFYTPNFVVKFLIDNSLGRYWKEIHPDSKIEKFCKYLILNEEISINNKKKKDIINIKLIDPACGSGHFLLYAFDVFLYMYKEAFENNWIKIQFDENLNLANLIIENNLFGLDIDRRAIQITNLALFLKSKIINVQSNYYSSNLITIDTILLNSSERDKFKNELGNNPDINNFIDKIWESISHSDELGSISKIKIQIKNFILQQIKIQKQLKIDSFIEIDKEKISNNFWQEFHSKLLRGLKLKLKSNAIKDKEQFLAGEFTRSLDYIDLLLKKYDIVVMNPPYGYGTKITQNYMKTYFPSANNNIFCAFIENWYNYLENNGILGAIVDNTFLVKKKYKKFRDVLITNKSLFLGADLGWDVLDDAQVATIALCLRKSPPELSCFIDLIEESEKEIYLNDIIKKNKILEKNSVYYKRLEIFNTFPNKALAYTVPNSILTILNESPSIDPNIGNSCQGLTTTNAKRFKRYHWEVNKTRIGKSKKWVTFANGGQFSPYYRPITEVVIWEDNGDEIKSAVVEKYKYLKGKYGWVVKNEKLYFNEGITWGKRSKILNVSFLPEETIFSDEGQAFFVEEKENLWYLIGLLNSKLTQFTLNTYCGQHKHSGYVGKIPFINITDIVKNKLIKLTKLIYELKEEWDIGNELSPNFKVHWFILKNDILNTDSIVKPLVAYIELKDSKLIEYQTTIDNLIYENIEISKEEIDFINESLESRPDTILWDDIRGYSKKKIEIELVESFISYSIGIVLNRWSSSEFNSSQDKDYCVFDHGSKLDIEDLLKNLWLNIFNEIYIVSEFEKILKKNMREYLKSTFFSYHSKKYKKNPIYWQLALPSKEFSVWLNYHSLSQELIFKLKNEVIEPKIKFEEENLRNLINQIKDAENNAEKTLIRSISREISETQKLIEELKEFHNNLMELIELNLPFDLDDGVTVNIAPFYKLIPWNEPKKIWDKINNGEYEWSSLFKHLKKRGNL